MKAISENIPRNAPQLLVFNTKTIEPSQTWLSNATDYNNNRSKQSWWLSDPMRKPIAIAEHGTNLMESGRTVLHVRNFNIEKIGSEDYGEYWILYSAIETEIIDNEKSYDYIVWKKTEAGTCPSPFPHRLSKNNYQDLVYEWNEKTGSPVVEQYLYIDFVECADYAMWLYAMLRKENAYKYYFKMIENQIMDENEFSKTYQIEL